MTHLSDLSLWPLFFFLAFATAGLGAFVRALPWPKSWLLRKPLACPLCLSGWAGFGWLLLLILHGSLPLTPLECGLLWFGLMGFAAPILARLYPPPLDLGSLDAP